MSEKELKNNLQVKVLSIIKKNFKKLIVLSILLIITFFSYLFYQNVKKNNEIKLSEQYTRASIQFKQKK